MAPAAEPLPVEAQEFEQPTPDALVMDQIAESLSIAEPLPPAPVLESAPVDAGTGRRVGEARSRESLTIR